MGDIYIVIKKILKMHSSDIIKLLNSKFNKKISILVEKDNYEYRDYIKSFCINHGNYNIRYDHLIDYGCSKCSRDKKNIDKQKNFIEKSNILHKNKFKYDKVVYKGNRNKIIITCPIHGDFSMSPFNHYTCGQGCKYCNHLLTTEDFISRSNIVHKEKYNYTKSIYINDKVKMEIICKLHGSFLQRPSSHLSGNGCPSCRESVGESKISKFLYEKNIKYERQKRFSGCKKKLELKFDFYIPIINTILEYDGIQHHQPIEFFGGVDRFNYELELQKIKEDYCLNNKIQLVRISYKENIEFILNKLLSTKNAHYNS